MKYLHHITLCACLALLAPATVSHAMLPPGAYDRLQAEAPEALVISVNSVKTTESTSPDRVTTSVSAEVQVNSVVRSKAGLKPQDVITITYQLVRYTRGPMPGPGEPGMLVEGKSYTAYLEQRPEGYRPVAYFASFVPVK